MSLKFNLLMFIWLEFTIKIPNQWEFLRKLKFIFFSLVYFLSYICKMWKIYIYHFTTLRQKDFILYSIIFLNKISCLCLNVILKSKFYH